MALFKSTEITAKEASSGEKYNNLSHAKTATFNLTTTTEAAADNAELVQLPVGSSVIGYSITDTGSGFTDVDLGITAGGVEIATGLNITAATVSGGLAPVAVGADGLVYLGFDAGTVVAAKLISGVIEYI
jgi:hypothetical protein